MDNLHVDGELTAAVIEDEDTDAATAALEGGAEALPQVGLLNDGQALLDVTALGHGDDAAVGHVEDAVLLEDGAEHGLDDDGGLRVGDERRLLVQLLGEQVDAQVAVLAGGGRGGDADDLAGAALQHQEVAQADVVARNGDRVGHVAAALLGRAGARAGADGGVRLADVPVNEDGVLAVFGNEAVSHALETPAEGAVLALIGGRERIPQLSFECPREFWG